MPSANDLCILADVRDWLNLNTAAMPITQIAVLAGGSGYTSATASVVAGTGVGSGLVLGTPTLQSGAVVAVPITTPGSYTVAPTIAITGNGTGASAVAYFAADVSLSRLITSCSALMLREMNRDTTLPTTVTERRNGSGTQRMVLARWPVIGMTQVIINNLVVIPSLDGVQAGWVTDGYSVMLVGSAFPVYMGYISGAVFVKGFQNVGFSYEYGWPAVPVDITQACIELVAQRWTRKGHIDQESVSMGGSVGQTTSYQKMAYPREVQRVLDRYQLKAILDA